MKGPIISVLESKLEGALNRKGLDVAWQELRWLLPFSQLEGESVQTLKPLRNDFKEIC